MDLPQFSKTRIGLHGYIEAFPLCEFSSLVSTIDRAFHSLKSLFTVCICYYSTNVHILIIPKYDSAWVAKMLRLRDKIYSFMQLFSGQLKKVVLSNDISVKVDPDLLKQILEHLTSTDIVYVVHSNDASYVELMNFIENLQLKPTVHPAIYHPENASYGILLRNPPVPYN
ncbi:hypothetical protein PvNV_058 [Penaeus vannamei nudivirus]|nr:hypothetical protein PvSNPV_058 [Penaeus vannamei nucleopolyhedrovirus]